MAEELDLDRGGWSMGEATFDWIVSHLGDRRPETIVEFGSGTSSVRLARAFSDAQILSIEHDEDHYRRSVSLRDRHLEGGGLDISLRPLAWQLRHGAWYRSYAPGPFPPRVDVVIVDGPPKRFQRGREACLYQVAAKLSLGGVVFLDDYSRPEEKVTATNWDAVFRGQFLTRIVDVGHGLCVKERVRRGTGFPAASVLRDSYGLLARRVWNRVSATRR